MEIDIKNNLTKIELWLIGFNFIQSKALNELYTFFLSEETNYPINENRKVIFFKKDTFLKVNEKYGFFYTKKNIKENLDLFCDIPLTIDIIKTVRFDKNSNVLDNINILTDILNFLQIEIPTKWRKKIFNLLDFLTFDKNIGEYLANKNNLKVDIIKSIEWIQKEILNNSITINSIDNLNFINTGSI